MMYFGEKVKKLREEQGISQAALGKIIDVSASNISQYEGGGTYPSVEKLIALAQYFRVSTDYLLGLSENADRFDYNRLTDDQTMAVMEIIRQYELMNARKR